MQKRLKPLSALTFGCSQILSTIFLKRNPTHQLSTLHSRFDIARHRGVPRHSHVSNSANFHKIFPILRIGPLQQCQVFPSQRSQGSFLSTFVPKDPYWDDSSHVKGPSIAPILQLFQYCHLADTDI